MKRINGFIIEGADQQGKSTVCEYMQEKLKWEVVHFPPPAEGFDFFNDYLVPNQTISDRNFPSEIVYSALRKEPCRIDQKTALCDTFRRRKFVMIILDRMEKHIIEERQELYTKKQILECAKLYRCLMPFGDIETYFINPENQMNIIDILLERAL